MSGHVLGWRPDAGCKEGARQEEADDQEVAWAAIWSTGERCTSEEALGKH